MAEPRNYKGKDLAPYQRFRPTKFYDGCFTADIMYCNWTCDHCWSGFGWRTIDPPYELTSDEVVEKVLAGMRRNGQMFCRFTGGEPSIYWKDHMKLVAQKFLEQTAGERIKVPGKRAKQELFLILESNGTALAPEDIDEFEALLGKEADRLRLTIGVKATSVEKLMSLTGHTKATATRFRERQIALAKRLADPKGYIGFSCLFLDKFTDPDELAEFEAMLAQICPGETFVEIEKFRTSGWGSKAHSTKHYTPKRDRETT